MRTYYYITGRQNTLPQVSLVFFRLLRHHLRTETAELRPFITYNNMGSKTLSTQCTFASLNPTREKTLNDMLACGIQGKAYQGSKNLLAEMLDLDNFPFKALKVAVINYESTWREGIFDALYELSLIHIYSIPSNREEQVEWKNWISKLPYR